MRFSDMMGSGAEQDPKPSTSDSEATIAAALAPYLDDAPSEPESVVPVAPVPPAAPAVVPFVASQVGSADVEPAPVAPVTPRPAAAPAATAPVAAPVIDYAPLSDDLLPRRR